MAKNNKKVQDDQRDYEKIVLSGMSIIMAGTLFIYFLFAVIFDRYLIGFSVDAIVGALAFAFLSKNLMVKYSVLKNKFSNYSAYLLVDILSFAVCFGIKIFVKTPFDFSLAILLVAYYITKNKFKNNTSKN